MINRVRALSRDESERRLSEAREKAERDRIGELEYAKDEGIEIGEARGIEIGRAEGREAGLADGIEQGRAEVARGMKAKGFSATDVADITDLSEEAVAAL